MELFDHESHTIIITFTGEDYLEKYFLKFNNKIECI